MAEKKIKITQIKSKVGETKNQKDTLKSLGLRRIRHSVIKENTPSIRGMLKKVSHIVKVEAV